MAQILIVDDEVGIRELIAEILREEGHDIVQAENAEAARMARETFRPDLVLLDIWMPDTDGITLLKEWAGGGRLTMPVVMMSGHATIDTAVEATRIGATNFLEKPIGMQKLLTTVRDALKHDQRTTAAQLSLAAFPRSQPLKELKKRLDQVGSGSRSILLRSSPGGFVELVARTIQGSGKGWLDLAHDSLPISLERLQGVSGGVIYVEELGRLVRLQQKNLLFAAERLAQFNLRLVVGTEWDSELLAAQGWDESVLARVFEGRLGLPALAEIRDEIPEVAAQILSQLVESGEVPPRRLTTAAQNALRQYGWPGGYLELKSTMKSMALAALETEMGAEDVWNLIRPFGGGQSAPARETLFSVMELPLREAREIFERLYFEHHIALDGGNMSQLAEKAGMERTHLYRKLRDLGLRAGRRGEEEQ